MKSNNNQRPPILRALLRINFVVTALAAPAAFGQYTITDLGTLGGTGSAAYGINNNGQIVGAALTSAAQWNAFVYSGGTMSGLGTLGGNFSLAYGINDNGQIVGWANTPANQANAFVYSGGSMTGLGTPISGGYSYATGINKSGHIVGFSANGPSPPPFTIGFVNNSYTQYGWLYTNGTATSLPTLGGSGTTPFTVAVNNKGQFAGASSITGNSAYHAFYNNGTAMIDLGTLGGANSYATSLNNNGQVAGESFTSGGQVNAFLYTGGSMMNLGTLGGGYSHACGLNDLAQVVGQANTAGGAYDAFLYSGGVMKDLNSLIPAGSGWALSVATAINSNGQIVGDGTNPAGQNDAFLLTPVPEPASWTLLAMAGLMFVARRKRQAQQPT